MWRFSYFTRYVAINQKDFPILRNSQRKIAKSSDCSGDQYSLSKSILKRQIRSGHLDLVLSEDSDLHQKRKNPFASQQNKQRKKTPMQARGGTLYNIPSTAEGSSKTEVEHTKRPHQLTSTRRPKQEIPVNVLDFLGGCVSYAEAGPTLNE